MTTQPAAPPPEPWWKHGYMWMVVGGPAVVVVASFITLYLALSRPDPVYSDTAPLARVPAATKAELAPAMQARNHAATGGVGRPTEAASQAPNRP